MRKRFAIAATAAMSAGLMALTPVVLAAGPNGGACSAAPGSGNVSVDNPVTGGNYYVNQSGGPTGGTAGAGVSGDSGFLDATATGAAGPPPSGSITVQGNQTQSGVNGKIVVSGSPSACAGSSVAGVGVGVP